jgi:hypothetical protein
MARGILHGFDYDAYRTQATSLLLPAANFVLGLAEGKKRWSDVVVAVRARQKKPSPRKKGTDIIVGMRPWTGTRRTGRLSFLCFKKICTPVGFHDWGESQDTHIKTECLFNIGHGPRNVINS